MAAATTDVRQWLRENGHDVKERGAIPADLHALYDQAHSPAGTVAGEVIHSQLEFSAGVTEADFPPADDEGEAPTGRSESESKPRTGRERRPRQVKAAAPRGIRERVFGGRKPAPRHARGPRVSLSDWAEETWSDLAWLAQPIPPLAKILTIQAPYAGVVFDEQVKGTVLDNALQPVAKYSGKWRALNGLAGPPVYVGLICATGARVQPVDPNTAKPAVYPDGSPVLVYDTRTQMLFQGLRYSLLQMTKISERSADEIRERAEESAERMRVVDQIIGDLFDMPAAPQFSPPAASRSAAGGDPGPGSNGFRYPDSPVMDGEGADPGRMT
jgi:hypothetical protein